MLTNKLGYEIIKEKKVARKVFGTKDRKMKKIYVLIGGDGEYSDYETWVFATFDDKDKAERSLAFLNNILDKNPQTFQETQKIAEEIKKYDEKMYHGNYWIEEKELNKIPEKLEKKNY